jgi:hypothetical protein
MKLVYWHYTWPHNLVKVFQDFFWWNLFIDSIHRFMLLKKLISDKFQTRNSVLSRSTTNHRLRKHFSRTLGLTGKSLSFLLEWALEMFYDREPHLLSAGDSIFLGGKISPGSWGKSYTKPWHCWSLSENEGKVLWHSLILGYLMLTIWF